MRSLSSPTCRCRAATCACVAASCSALSSSTSETIHEARVAVTTPMSATPPIMSSAAMKRPSVETGKVSP